MARITGGTDLDAVMGGELRGVDRDASAVAMGELRHLVDGGDKTGDVGCSAHRDQADPAARLFQGVLDRS